MEWLDNDQQDATAALLAWASDQLAHQTVTGYLERAGLRILARDWRCTTGQADIIAAEGRVLVVCQVTSRPINGTIARMRARGRSRRLRQIGIQWLTAHGVLYDELRVDLISLTRDSTCGFTIEHVRGVA